MRIMTNNCFILASHVSEKIDEFARQTGYPVVSEVANLQAFYLQYLDEKLCLLKMVEDEFLSISIDFSSGKLRHRRLYGGGKQQALGRAIGIKHLKFPRVLDATAGLGSDAFVLATLGCQVTLLERSEILCLLLNDAMQRAKADAELIETIDRMQLLNVDAREFLQNCPSVFDVVYLDPMFPERKKTAKVKKEMQLLQQLFAHVANESDQELLAFAKQVAEKRVVVKRPLHAGFFAGQQPTHQITGKSTRFDVYIK